MHRLFQQSSLILTTWCLLSGIASSQQLNVTDPLWGFDGKTLSGRFNLFSATLTNAGATPFDGPVYLSPENRGSAQSQQIYLAPGQQRTVQFVVFIGYYDTFSLSWRGGDSTLPDPAPGPPATVHIVQDDRTSSSDSPIRAFPDSRFPSSVTGTSNLHAAVLTRVPRWDAAKRTAFMDWVRGGGIVALGREPGGGYPKFSEELADLNAPSDQPFRIGSGLVVQLDAAESEISPALLRKAGIGEPENFTADSGYRIETEIPPHLGKITRPQISWSQIFSIAFLYVLIIGPLHFFWGRKQRRALVSIGAFLATVALFSWIFTVIGRRGYGESTRVYSLSIANDIGSGNYDVTQWSNVFVTSGDVYTLSHPQADSSSYARDDFEAASSTKFFVSSGKGASITAEIPLFSHSSFLQRARFPGPTITPKVTAWEKDDSRLRRLDLEVPDGFPSAAQLWLRHRMLFYPLVKNGSQITLSTSRPLPRETFFSPENLRKVSRYDQFDYGYGYGGTPGGSGTATRDARERMAFEDALHLLVAIATSGSAELASAFDRPHESAPDSADLFIYTESPPSFHLVAPFGESERGFTLFRTAIFPPPSSP